MILSGYRGIGKTQKIVNAVLEQIRADLHATAEMHDDGNYYLRDEWIDEYFDKYKENKNERDREHN